jgi:DNA repair photolyase
MPRPVDNPPNPWASTHVEYLGEPPPAALAVYEEDARSVIASNDSPDVPFRYSVNPYRGCFHGCAYCYARPSHELLGFGAGTDFERRIVVKRNAPEVLARQLAAPSWKGELLAFSGVTDCYQPLEASYGLTRKMLEICLAHRNPVGVVTKGALVERDVDLLAALSREATATVFVSIPFADEGHARAIEPYASSLARRFGALRRLSEAGVRTGVSVSPVIPGLNDAEIPEILERAKEAGAELAFMIMLRLPASVRPVFVERLRSALPQRAERVLSAIRDVRDGALNRAAFGERMRGEGPRWQAIETLFQVHRRRLGFVDGERFDHGPTTFRRPKPVDPRAESKADAQADTQADTQLDLFGK